MEQIIQDWKFWGFVIQGCLTMICFAIIKFNDLKHLTKEVEKLDIKVGCIDKKVTNMKTDIAVLEEKTKDL